MHLLETGKLCVTIGNTRVCDALDLAIDAGDRWCILGRNGTGKTTLLHTLAGLRSVLAGDITLDGTVTATTATQEHRPTHWPVIPGS